MSFANFDHPLNAQLGKVSSFKKSHQDPAQNGYGVPRVCCDNLLAKGRFNRLVMHGLFLT